MQYNLSEIIYMARTYALAISLLAGISLFSIGRAGDAQVRRYEPSTPTVSPYLNLFRDDVDNRSRLPNYYLYVRPLEQQYRANQQQRVQLQQQKREIGQLQANVEELDRRQAEGPLVSPTGTGSWFGRPGTRSTFLNTSRYYSQSGTVQQR